MKPRNIVCYRCRKTYSGDRRQGNLCPECIAKPRRTTPEEREAADPELACLRCVLPRCMESSPECLVTTWRFQNKAKIAATSKRYYEANGEIMRDKAKEYRQANKEQIAAKKRSRREAVRDAVKQLRAEKKAQGVSANV